jgi:hypothetical protein
MAHSQGGREEEKGCHAREPKSGGGRRRFGEWSHDALRIWKPERKTISTSMPVGISMTG